MGKSGKAKDRTSALAEGKDDTHKNAQANLSAIAHTLEMAFNSSPRGRKPHPIFWGGPTIDRCMIDVSFVWSIPFANPFHFWTPGSTPHLHQAVVRSLRRREEAAEQLSDADRDHFEVCLREEEECRLEEVVSLINPL